MRLKKFMQDHLPFWNFLTEIQKERIVQHSFIQKYKKGTTMNYSSESCTGIQIFKSGRARVFISSPDGRGITLYRLVDLDVCVFSAGCMLKNLSFNVSMEIEADSEVIVIERNIYKVISEENSAVKDFTMEMVASKFSDVMWLLEHLVFSNMGKRLASALLEQRDFFNNNILEITHEKLAFDLGTAREVVTRLLKQFQLDGYVHLSRGKIKLLNEKGLLHLKK